MTDDPLDGYRGTALKLGRVLSDADPDDNEVWSRLYLGQAAQKIMQGIAERKEVGKVLATLIAQCELETQEACRAILHEDDSASAICRQAHFSARIAAGILGRLNAFIRDGEAAAATINDQDPRG